MATNYRRKLRYDRSKDANTTSYLGADGCYYYTGNKDNGGNEKKVLFRFDPNDYENGAEIILVLDEMDRYEDEQEDAINSHIDKVFLEKLCRHECCEDEGQFSDPWDSVAFANGDRDLFSYIFPDENPTDEQLEKLEAFIQTLQPQQIDLIYQHYGAQRTLQELRLEEQECTGKTISQQAYSDRLRKIQDRICKHLGVARPQKRKK